MEFIADSFLLPATLGVLDALVPLAGKMTLEWFFESFDGDIKKLQRRLMSIRELLSDGGRDLLSDGGRDLLSDGGHPNSELVKGLLKDLKSGISHAEEVLDELEYEAVRRKIEVRNRKHKVRDFFSLSNPLAFRLKAVSRLQQTNLLLDRIFRQSINIRERSSTGIGRFGITMSKDVVQSREFHRTGPFIVDSTVVGRDRDVSTVRDMLLGYFEDDLSVVAIVGRAGLGKTALAQLIHNDETVQRYFEPIWIGVSGEIKAGRVLNEMIEIYTGDGSETTNIAGAVGKLQELLKQRRCLLILDDVWKTNANEWVDMRSCLREIYGSKGSKILVTARTTEVLSTMQIFPSVTHNLDVLSDDDSWTMFKKLAFANGGPRETDTLVEIGRRIVGNCKGSPLLITSAADVLYFKKDEQDWELFAENIETWLRTCLERLLPPSPIDDIQPRELRPTHPFVDDSRVVGRDEDVSKVRSMLLGSFEDYLSVVAILGMDGLGKTTLAQLIWKDETVQHCFGPIMWICVPGEIKAERLLNEMIENLTAKRSDIQNMERLVRILREELKGKRYLLIIDDFWIINESKWTEIRSSLLGIDGSRGSKILVTTHNMDVVATMGASCRHELGKLSGGDSWTLFRKIAFADGGPRETQSLVKIGKRLVENCKGVPFVIKSLASLLSFKHDESEWMSMYYNESWSSVATEPELLERLRLTFDQLPTLLKLCFACCAVFPKGRDIKKDELIQFWMSLGYLRSSWIGLDMEDVGDEFYHILLRKFLLEKGETDDYKNITSCKMPDHVHDFAVHLYEGYHQTLEPSTRKYHTMVEHLSSDFWEEKGVDIPKGNVKMLTALFPKISVEVNRTLAFGLFGDDVEELPNFVCKFKHLGYLDLSETAIKKLPSFITKLYFLQTLKLPIGLMELPKEFHKLVSLRHWCMPDAKKSRELMPMKIGQLTCLRTLPFFVVGEVSGCGIEELGRLSKLRGRLHVYSLQHVKDTEEAEKANISAKSDIRELGFHWDYQAEVEEDAHTCNQEKVLEGLRPHMSIQGLILENFSGRRFPSWMVDAELLRRLVKIELRDCSLCEQVPSLGYLGCLEIIEVVNFENLKCIGPEFCGPDDRRAPAAEVFPALRKLTLGGMERLQKWQLPDDTGSTVFFPCLEELNISGCPLLISIPVHLFSTRDIQELTISSLRPSDVESRKKHHRSLTIFSAYWGSKLLDSVGYLLEKSSKSMRTLTIRGLNELPYLPNILSNLASLEKLEISECSNLTFDIKGTAVFFGLSHLRQLSVRQCPRLTYLPVELVKETLVTLEIDTCRDLTAVELGSLTSLEELMIKGCRGLLSCWKDSPLKTTSLRRLETDAFSEKLEYFPTNDPVSTDDSQHSNQYGQPQPHASTSACIADAKQPRLFSLKDLSSLHLWGWEKLTCLPEGLQHLTTLTELSIHSFHSLEALPDWLANLSSLESLELHSCKNLAILPKQRLRIRQLTIVNCPLLAKRCGKQTGEEWAKITLIPSVKFSVFC